MEVEFACTREDWVEINTRHYRNWLHAQRPLVGTEFGICWFMLLLSVAGGVGLVGFLGAAVWLNLDWYFVAGAAALFVFVCGMFLEVVRPRREPVRGLLHELIFRMGWQDRLLAKVKGRRAADARRLEVKGQLVLSHRYHLRLDPDGLTLTTEYHSATGTATRQEDRAGWGSVCAIDHDDHLVTFTLGDGRCVFVPRSAFADQETCDRFLRAANAYRAAPALADTRIQAPGGVCPGVGAGHFQNRGAAGGLPKRWPEAEFHEIDT
jgi:hypothetical protein